MPGKLKYMEKKYNDTGNLLKNALNEKMMMNGLTENCEKGNTVKRW